MGKFSLGLWSVGMSLSASLLFFFYVINPLEQLKAEWKRKKKSAKDCFLETELIVGPFTLAKIFRLSAGYCVYTWPSWFEKQAVLGSVVE